MMYLVSSPHGPLPAAEWSCREPGCPSGSGLVWREPGDRGDQVRNQAADHLAETGHPVQFRRGTAEDLVPVRAATTPDEVRAAYAAEGLAETDAGWCDVVRCRWPFGSHAPACRPLPAAPEVRHG